MRIHARQAQQQQAFLAELETKKVERQRLAAEQATALAAEMAPIIADLTQAWTGPAGMTAAIRTKPMRTNPRQ